jgi:hypothetical protein
MYADEIWTGIEYQVAAHLMYEGFVDEAVNIVRTTRERHDGHLRNPWNEVEAGNHYARSMSSWALLLAWSGYRYDATRASIGFAPASREGELRTFFSAGSGWGTFHQDRKGAYLNLEDGSLRLRQLEVVPPAGCEATDVMVAGQSIHAQREASGQTIRFVFKPVTLEVGAGLTVPFAVL